MKETPVFLWRGILRITLTEIEMVNHTGKMPLEPAGPHTLQLY